MSDFGYNPQAQYPAGQIGDGNGLGVGDWRFAFAGIDPMNPTHPVPPPQTDSKPPPRLVPVNGKTLPASASGPGKPAPPGILSPNPNSFWLVALAGIDPQDPTRLAPPPLDDHLRGFYRDDPMQPWFVQRQR